MRAASEGNLQQVQRLLAEGANVDSADELGRTALMQAAGAWQLEVMHALLDAGADVARRDREGKTVIDIATAHGRSLVGQSLGVAHRAGGCRQHGFDCRNTASAAAPTQAKALPLSLLQAAEEQDLQGMQVLLARLRLQKKDVAVALNQRGKLRDADGNITTRESTPLLTAVRLGNASLASLLLQAGANSEQTDADGKTALVLAIEHGNAALVDALLEAGASVDDKDGKQGWTR